MFAGSYRHQVDPKGRVAIPHRFRDQLAGESFISLGADSVVTVFPEEVWATMSHDMQERDRAAESQRMLARLMFGMAQKCEFDTQGRILLSSELRRRASIQTQVVVVGANTVVEIWDAGAWDAYMAENVDHYTELMDKVVH